MKVYAIRHIPTGRFMPVPTGKNGSGSSYWDPLTDSHNPQITKTPVDGVTVYGIPLPRLFPLRRSASSALTQWLRGRHVVVTERTHPDDGFGQSWDEPVGTAVEHDSSRKADDMEIVAFELVEVGK